MAFLTKEQTKIIKEKWIKKILNDDNEIKIYMYDCEDGFYLSLQLVDLNGDLIEYIDFENNETIEEIETKSKKLRKEVKRKVESCINKDLDYEIVYCKF